MPSPTPVTTMANDAVALLTSRYSKQRPFTPFQLQPVFWWKTSQNLTVVPTNDVKAWTDNRGSVATPAVGDPTAIPTDPSFNNQESLQFVNAALDSVSVTVSPDPTALTVVVVASDDTGANAGLTIFNVALPAGAVSPQASTQTQGIRVVEALVVARLLTSDEIAGLKAYYQTLYGVGVV